MLMAGIRVALIGIQQFNHMRLASDAPQTEQTWFVEIYKTYFQPRYIVNRDWLNHHQNRGMHKYIYVNSGV